MSNREVDSLSHEVTSNKIIIPNFEIHLISQLIEFKRELLIKDRHIIRIGHHFGYELLIWASEINSNVRVCSGAGDVSDIGRQLGLIKVAYEGS